MDFVLGGALSELSRKFRTAENQGQMPLNIANRQMIGALEGLHAAHEINGSDGSPLHLVHRDVSPHNILVGRDGITRILDFGIAKAMGRLQHTRQGHLKGKLAYMAPEQLEQGEMDRRVDVYAAGIVMWELLTGKRLFHTDDEATTFRKALESRVVPPSRLRPALDPRMDQIVMRALSRSPDARFPSARAMAEAIEDVGPVATAREVGNWVNQLIGLQLDALSNDIARQEAMGPSGAPSAQQEGGQGAVSGSTLGAVSGSTLGGVSGAVPGAQGRRASGDGSGAEDSAGFDENTLAAAIAQARAMESHTLAGAETARFIAPDLSKAPPGQGVVVPPAAVSGTTSTDPSDGGQAPNTSKRRRWVWGWLLVLIIPALAYGVAYVRARRQGEQQPVKSPQKLQPPVPNDPMVNTASPGAAGMNRAGAAPSGRPQADGNAVRSRPAPALPATGNTRPDIKTTLRSAKTTRSQKAGDSKRSRRRATKRKASPKSRRRVTRQKRSRRPVAQPGAANCEILFRVDKDGVRVPKTECLK